MAEFDNACTSPPTKLWLIYMNMVMLLKRYAHADRTCLRAEHLVEVGPACPLPRSDERPAYTGYEHTEGIPGWTVHCMSNRREMQWYLDIHGITSDIQT